MAKLRDLTKEEQTRYADDWRGIEARFIDDPAATLQDADRTARAVMVDIGYPMTDAEQQAADLSVHHAGVVEHYRTALVTRPGDGTAAFNLGVALEDLNRLGEAIAAYEQSIAIDANNADAHYNVARLFEQSGNSESAIKHLLIYRQLTRKRR